MRRARIRRWRAATVLAATLTVAGVLAACASSSEGSRATLYASVDELAADSSAIVVGAVTLQRQDGDETVSSVLVESAPTNPRLAANLEGSASPVGPGDVVEVRQLGGPRLVRGGQYALFLTPTMLPGDAASQYYITGAEAGIYVRDGGEFRRVALDSGDTLPETIQLAP